MFGDDLAEAGWVTVDKDRAEVLLKLMLMGVDHWSHRVCDLRGNDREIATFATEVVFRGRRVSVGKSAEVINESTKGTSNKCPLRVIRRRLVW